MADEVVNVEMQNLSENATFKFSAVNKNPFFRLNFNWTIENFVEDPSSSLVSPEIQLPGMTWNFVCKTRPEFRGDIYIRNNSATFVFVKGMVYYSAKHCHIKQKIASGDNKIFTDSILNLSNPKFQFRLKIYGLMKKQCLFNEENPLRDLADPHLHRKNMLNKFQTLFKNRRFSDVRIRVGKKIVHAHKCVLSAMSPVFADMFKQATDSSTVKVTDVPFGILETGLGFMYGKFPDDKTLKDWDKMCKLYNMSDKYGLLDLREICGKALLKKMTVENVWKLVDLCDHHSDSEFLKQVGSFCCINFDDVVNTDGWKRLIRENALSACIVLEQYTNMNKSDAGN